MVNQRRCLAQWSLLWTLLPALVAFAGGTEKFGAEARFDFRNGQFDNSRLLLVGRGAARLALPTPVGLRTYIPDGVGPDKVGFMPKLVLRGDFEITATFAIQSTNPPDKGHGVGPTIHIVTCSEDAHAATVGRIRRRGEGDVFSAHYAHNPRGNQTGDKEGKRNRDVRFLKTKARTGRLRLTRFGTKLRFLAAEEESEQFRELWEIDFTDADVRQIRVGLDRHGAATSADVVWKDFIIRAHEFPKSARLDWLLYGAGALVSVVVLVGGVSYWRRCRAM